MKLKRLLETFDFDDFFPEVCVMYPNAKRHKREFMRAFNMLYALEPQPSKKAIRSSSVSHFSAFFFRSSISSRLISSNLVARPSRRRCLVPSAYTYLHVMRVGASQVSSDFIVVRKRGPRAVRPHMRRGALPRARRRGFRRCVLLENRETKE